jgi:putative ABC transport system permease protein
MMRDLLSDVRYALRGLFTHPVFTIAAVLTLALGIGLTTTIFGVVNGILLRPLSFPNADRLVTICELYPGATADWCSISPPNVEDIARRSRTIEAIGIARSWPYHLATTQGAEGINGGLATPELFTALGVRPELGRLIDRADLTGRESSVVLLTHEMWQARFGGAADVIGSVISLDGHAVTIVGVLPRGFELPQFPGLELWRPVHIDPRDEQHRNWRGFVAYGRLKDGTSIAVARRELAGIAKQLQREHFASTAQWGLTMTSLQDLVVGQVRPVLLVFLGAVVLVLLIACANVANLLLARATGRAGEMALRLALGASRWRIVRGLLVEGFLLALIGSALGMMIVVWGTSAFVALAPPSVPRIEDVRVDARVLAFALGLSIVSTIVFALTPALRATGTDLAQALREGGRASSRGGWLGKLLVVGELAIALTLTVGAGLLLRSFIARSSWSPGFDREHVLTFTLFAPSEKLGGPSGVARLWRRVETDLASIPGVVAVGSASGGPLFGGVENDDVEFAGHAGPVRRAARWFDVSPGYFHALGVPLELGRNLDESDGIDSPPVALVNETLARRFWPGASPLGKRISLFDHRLTVQVVGVVKDVPAVLPDAPVEPEIYWSNRQQPRGFSYFILRTDVPPASIVATVRERVRAVDRDLDASNVESMASLMSWRLRTPRFEMLLLSSFSAVALALAAIGTYGLFAYLIARRTRELGIRIALGAERRHIVAAVVGDGLRLAALGLSIGIASSLILVRAVRTMVVGVSPFDPLTLIGGSLLLLIVATLACLAPARRASNVDPAVTLAAE